MREPKGSGQPRQVRGRIDALRRRGVKIVASGYPGARVFHVEGELMGESVDVVTPAKKQVPRRPRPKTPPLKRLPEASEASPEQERAVTATAFTNSLSVASASAYL